MSGYAGVPVWSQAPAFLPRTARRENTSLLKSRRGTVGMHCIKTLSVPGCCGLWAVDVLLHWWSNSAVSLRLSLCSQLLRVPANLGPLCCLGTDGEPQGVSVAVADGTACPKVKKHLYHKREHRHKDFSGGLTVHTPHSQCKGSRFNPWSGNEIPYAAAKDPAVKAEDPACHN